MTEGYGGESTTDEARRRSQEVAQRGQQRASEYAERGREQARGQIATQKERVSGELQGIARALRTTGDQLKEQDQGSVGRYAEQAAERVGRLSDYLSEKDSEQLIGEVEDFARQKPAVFLGGAFVLGVAAARFLKSSAGQTGDLREELKHEAREVRESVSPGDGGSSGESASGGAGSMSEWRGTSGEAGYRRDPEPG